MIVLQYEMLVPEPEHWTVCINGNQKEVRTVGMSMNLIKRLLSARTGTLELECKSH